MTEDQVRDEIREKTKASSLRRIAKEYGLSPAYLSDILSGQRGVSEKVAGIFGFYKTVTTEVTFRRK